MLNFILSYPSLSCSILLSFILVVVVLRSLTTTNCKKWAKNKTASQKQLKNKFKKSDLLKNIKERRNREQGQGTVV